MPYQNLSPEIILAVGIWLFAIFVFVMMLLVVLVKLLSENWAKNRYGPKDELQTTGEPPLQGNENPPLKEAELNVPAWDPNQQAHPQIRNQLS